MRRVGSEAAWTGRPSETGAEGVANGGAQTECVAHIDFSCAKQTSKNDVDQDDRARSSDSGWAVHDYGTVVQLIALEYSDLHFQSLRSWLIYRLFCSTYVQVSYK